MIGTFILPYTDYLDRLREPRSLLDLALVFLIVYTVLKLLRGTRAAPMAAGLAAFTLLYLVAYRYDLATLEFVLRGALIYIGVAIIVLFQPELRQALTSLGNRIRLPSLARHRGQFGEGVYDEIVLAATTLASTKTGALVVIERNISLRNVTEGGAVARAEVFREARVQGERQEAGRRRDAVATHDDRAVVQRRRRVEDRDEQIVGEVCVEAHAGVGHAA